MSTALLALALLPFAGMLLPLLARRVGGAPAAYAGAVALLAFALVLVLAPAALAGETLVARWPWVPALGLEFALRWDGLACLYAGLVTALGALVIGYAHWYLHDDPDAPRIHALLLAFMGSMLGLVLSENLVVLAICWELTSLVSFLLIGVRGDAEGRRGARLALLVTGSGGLALLAAVVLLGWVVGSWSLSDVLAAAPAVRADPLYGPILALVLYAAFTKSAQFPLHVWLPNAMAAPTPVSAYLHSATLVKAGIFLLLRLYPVLAGSEAWFWSVGATGVSTLLFASAVALYRHDLKGLLAYSTVSHLGLIVLLLGLGTPLGVVAAVFHLLNHAVFKASLFMAAGIVDHQAGTRDMRRLSGLARAMPYTATLAIVAAAAMAGVPLLNGFLSKEMFFAETLVLRELGGFGLVLPAAAVLAGVFTVAYSTRFVHDVFFGGRATDLPQPIAEAPRWLRVPVEVLVALCLLIGLAPGATVEPLLRAAAGSALQAPLPAFSLAIWHGVNLPLAMSAVALCGGVALYFLRRRAGLHAHRAPRLDGRRLAESLVDGLQDGARLFWPAFAADRLQRSLFVLLVLVLAVGVLGHLDTPLTGTRAPLAPTPGAIAGFALLVAATLGALVAHRDRLTALVCTSIVGLVVALAYATFSAPDLALTQILVETATVLLLLLVLRHLPPVAPVAPNAAREPRDPAWLRDALLALGSGAGAGALAWAMLTRPVDSIGGWYLGAAPAQGAGYNVVNVILVDFRGFDTLGEITVLGIAALGVAALLRGVLPAPSAFDPLGRAWSTAPRSPALAVTAGPVLAFALLLALHLFLRGHDAPGGGFAAGLVTAIALHVLALAHGREWLAERLRLDATRVLALGLALALATGLGSLAFAHPFLTSSAPAAVVPLLGKLKLPTATFFDAGVYLTVVATVLLVLDRVGGRSAGARA